MPLCVHYACFEHCLSAAVFMTVWYRKFVLSKKCDQREIGEDLVELFSQNVE